ncbi:MAG TPA: DUF1697 domain-containing protein [Sphingomonas sp.]|nr:DUF1697 domain-containing protein [Sphingomonas sp.]
MTSYVALLRAVNVGGTGKLPMTELKAMCEKAGFDRVRTYIASGNAAFAADGSEAEVKTALETRLEAYAGKKVGVLVRTAVEIADVLTANPYPDVPPAKVLVIFLDEPPGRDALAVRRQTSEELRPGKREIYIHYPDGMGRSQLVVPAAKAGTGRNINTVKELARMAAEIS